MTEKRNYHMSLTRIAPTGVDAFRCDYCGAQGRFDDLRISQCSHIYEICKACGGSDDSNECRPDCRGCLEALADVMEDPRVYVAGKMDES